ncbi:MAG: hypothetical protein HUJ68_09765 [Clostridia bacterium]|nr:hypothetical protein [Clostridia bacterium]
MELKDYLYRLNNAKTDEDRAYIKELYVKDKFKSLELLTVDELKHIIEYREHPAEYLEQAFDVLCKKYEAELLCKDKDIEKLKTRINCLEKAVEIMSKPDFKKECGNCLLCDESTSLCAGCENYSKWVMYVGQ